MFLMALSLFRKPGCPASPGNEEGPTAWSPRSLGSTLRGHSLNVSCPFRRDGPLGAAPGSRAAYLLQLELRGEPLGRCPDEVGEGEGTSAIAVRRGTEEPGGAEN